MSEYNLVYWNDSHCLELIQQESIIKMCISCDFTTWPPLGSWPIFFYTFWRQIAKDMWRSSTWHNFALIQTKLAYPLWSSWELNSSKWCVYFFVAYIFITLSEHNTWSCPTAYQTWSGSKKFAKQKTKVVKGKRCTPRITSVFVTIKSFNATCSYHL